MADVLITGKISGDEVQGLMRRSPRVFSRYINKFLFKEARVFIGDKKKDGIVRRQFANKLTAKNQPWETKMVHLFNFAFNDKGNLDRTLEMGILANNKKHIHEVLQYLGEGGEVTSDKFMPIPIWQNLGADIKKQHGLFLWKMKAGDLFTVYKNGKAYYFDKNEPDKGALWYGVKAITIKKKYKFDELWTRRSRNLNKRADKMLAKAISTASSKEEKYYDLDTDEDE